MKKTIITVVIIIIVIVAISLIFRSPSKTSVVTETPASTTDMTAETATSTGTGTQAMDMSGPVTVIGKSVQGRDITAYNYGTGTSTRLLFVGGIHGGYEWNTVQVAYKLMDYLSNNLSAIPAGVRVTVIPVLNPDGLNTAVGTTSPNFTIDDVSDSSATVIAGRFNGNSVDLNRNFDCDWQATGKWQSRSVSGGTAAFSEPESQAIKNYVETNKPIAVVVWYSAAGGVYASNCHTGVLPETNTILKKFADASGYPSHESFDFYATTGDMVNWLAKVGVPGISVLLKNHSDIDWQQNLAGVKALLTYYSK